jgi:hypothetical protein
MKNEKWKMENEPFLTCNLAVLEPFPSTVAPLALFVDTLLERQLLCPRLQIR